MAKKVPSWARARKSRSISASNGFRVREAMALPTLAGPAINEQTALSITPVYSAVSLISNAIACLKSGVAERSKDGGHRQAVELPLFDALARKPNRQNTAFRFRKATMVHALCSGNGYSEIEFRGKTPVGFHLLDPYNVNPVIRDNGDLVYRLIREGVDLPAWKVVHVANLGWDGVRGYSPITLARETLGLAKSQELHQAGLMGNSATPSGFIEVPRIMKEPDKNRYRSDFEAMHKGTENAGTVGILDGGARWIATSFSPADAELILSRGFSVAEVARLFCIPQHLIGLLDHATFSNIEQQLMEFYTFTLLPWIVNIEQEMDTKVFSRVERQSYFVYHDLKSLLRADTATQSTQDSADFKIGVKSQNEIRRGRGENPIDNPNADKHYIEANNMVAIEDMGKATPRPDAPDLVVGPDADAGDDGTQKPGGPSERSMTAVRELLSQSIRRMLRIEFEAARRASRKERFDLWTQEFSPKHAAKLAEALAPSLEVSSILTGRSFQPKSVADALAEVTRNEFLGLAKSVPPDELPGAVDRLCNDLEYVQVKAFLDRILGG